MIELRYMEAQSKLQNLLTHPDFNYERISDAFEAAKFWERIILKLKEVSI